MVTLSQPTAPEVPEPPSADGATGVVLWHREHLRTQDHRGIATAADSEALLPLFVFDPAFYDGSGLACDARIRFLHECLEDLDDTYRSLTGTGLTYGYGDPVEILSRFQDAGWDLVAMASPTGRYGKRRDKRAAECGVTFVDGDGLVRRVEDTREGWQAHFESWVTSPQHDWDPQGVTVRGAPTDVTVEGIEQEHEVSPKKSQVPTGGVREAKETLEAFVKRIGQYPGSISAPQDARDGCSGLSAYLKFGCLSVREVYQYVDEHAPDGRGKQMFQSRLAWNKHYEQKLEDWSGWLDTAVNPVLRGFNDEHHDSELIRAWMDGRTGYPMVDASMRCLRDTGWLNFRMRAMCASFLYHILQQPWQVGADYYYYHLIDAVAGINYTQWQSQTGVVGKPTLRLYNPRKQVREHDPDGEWIRSWVPELTGLPAQFMDAPEKTPLHIQEDCGVHIGNDADYPYPVVEFETARKKFLDRYKAAKPAAAARLGDPDIARRASLSGGQSAAVSIAERHGGDTSSSVDESQSTLDSFPEE